VDIVRRVIFDRWGKVPKGVDEGMAHVEKIVVHTVPVQNGLGVPDENNNLYVLEKPLLPQK